MEEDLKIEVLFPEFCNLYGDISNIKYLKKCLPNAKFYETAFDEELIFIKEKVNFIYLGPMTEKMQEKVINKLKPYKERIKELIDENVVFLVTGNAIEIFGKYIENEDGTKIDALDIFDIYAKRDMLHRHNSIFIGNWEDIKVVGFKSQFTFAYGNNENDYFAKVEKGIGLNKESNFSLLNVPSSVFNAVRTASSNLEGYPISKVIFFTVNNAFLFMIGSGESFS